MELRQIRYFAAVARHQSFTRAAEELFLAQPSLSQQIQNLERELGVSLLDRSGRRVRPTDAGAAFLVWAEHILTAVAGAEAAMAEFAGLRRGRVLIGTIPMQALGLVSLPDILAGFHARYPGIEVVLREEITAELLGQLRAGRLDLAFGVVMGAPSLPQVAMVPFGTEDLVAIAAPGHRLDGRRANITELADEPFIFFKEGSPVRRATLQAAADAGITLRIGFETNEVPMLRALASRGLGIGVVPRSLAAASGEVVAVVELADLTVRRTIALLWSTEHFRSAAARAFLTFAREQAPGGLTNSGE